MDYRFYYSFYCVDDYISNFFGVSVWVHMSYDEFKQIMTLKGDIVLEKWWGEYMKDRYNECMII